MHANERQILLFFQRELAGKSTVDIMQQCKQLLPLPPLSHNVFTVSPVKETPGNPGQNVADKLPPGGGSSSQVYFCYRVIFVFQLQTRLIITCIDTISVTFWSSNSFLLLGNYFKSSIGVGVISYMYCTSNSLTIMVQLCKVPYEK